MSINFAEIPMLTTKYAFFFSLHCTVDTFTLCYHRPSNRGKTGAVERKHNAPGCHPHSAHAPAVSTACDISGTSGILHTRLPRPSIVLPRLTGYSTFSNGI